MAALFDTCLARTLQFETSYKQPIGGPFVRWMPTKRHPVSPLQSGKPDGLAYDDDPDDTGGRTCMGILQREYDGWRKNRGRAKQDVWRIADDELTDIYRRQFWNPLRCEELPAGIDFLVFDAGVNCGIGMGAKLLQRALGIRDDGHIGQVTIAAANAINDIEGLIERFAEKREQYHRACKTFWKHGEGWLKRTAQASLVAKGIVETRIVGLTVDFAEHSRRALPPQAVETVAETATGKREVFQASTGAGLTFDRGLELYGKANEVGLMEAVLKNPATIALMLIGIGLILNARFGWLDRYRKLVLGGV